MITMLRTCTRAPIARSLKLTRASQIRRSPNFTPPADLSKVNLAANFAGANLAATISKANLAANLAGANLAADLSKVNLAANFAGAKTGCEH
jgi:hypothetical protein